MVLETKELHDTPRHHSGGVFTPLPLFSKRQGLGPSGTRGSGGRARPGWVSHPSAQETFLRPCLHPRLPPCNGAKPRVLLPNPGRHLGARGGSGGAQAVAKPGGPQPTPSTWLGKGGSRCSPVPLHHILFQRFHYQSMPTGCPRRHPKESQVPCSGQPLRTARHRSPRCSLPARTRARPARLPWRTERRI